MEGLVEGAEMEPPGCRIQDSFFFPYQGISGFILQQFCASFNVEKGSGKAES